ncbi:MAG: hypothetical protein JWN45_286 [Acidobacteriaceae bacterium]|nr:hypothetical protein [Acidobacteriaceae bacterium]
MPKSANKRRCFAIVLCVFAIATSGVAQQKRKKAVPAAKAKAVDTVPVREKIAEGKYELKKQDGKVAQIVGEPWTLYRTNVGYELQEQWIVSKDTQEQPTIIDVGVNFAPGLFPIQIRIGGIGSAKELNCSMQAKEFSCDSAGLHATMAMDRPYNLYLPSPWMLGSIARRAKKMPDKPSKVRLVQMVGMTSAGPKLDSFEAEVQYIGEDEIDVSGERIPASIFEMKTKTMPNIMVWLSPEGVVLVMQGSSKPEQRMELTKFTKFAKF